MDKVKNEHPSKEARNGALLVPSISHNFMGTNHSLFLRPIEKYTFANEIHELIFHYRALLKKSLF